MQAGLIRWLVLFFNDTLLPAIKKFLRTLQQLWQKVKHKREAISDALFVIRSLWFFLLLNVIAVVFFWILPQGIDILYAMLEDFYAVRPAPLLLLCLATIIWSMFAEFAARYRLMIKDNSGNFLSRERVAWRKFVQKTFVELFVLFPLIVMTVGVIRASYRWEDGYITPLKVASWPILIFIFCFVLLYHLYFGQLRKLFVQFFRQPADYLQSDEYKMKSLLIGIYNDYVFRYHNEYIKGGDASLHHGKFAIDPDWNKLALDALPDELKHFPKSDAVPFAARPHQDAILKRITFPTHTSTETDVYIRWEYAMPYRLYPLLNREIRVVGWGGLFLLVLVSLLPIQAYVYIGSAALVAFAFAGWIGFITALLFLDNARPFAKPFSLLNRFPWRVALFCWILICSYINHDHPVRVLPNDTVNLQKNRLTLSEHFKRWVALRYNQSTTNDTMQRIPMVLVCAEGGALRTGAMSAMLLGKLQTKYPDFKDNIYAFSTVSGGSLGVGFFNAVNYRNQMATDQSQTFFWYDFLAPVIARMFFGDIFHLMMPRHSDWFDRAVALEKAWEYGYRKTVGACEKDPAFEAAFLPSIDSSGRTPAWLINTTDVEAGHQSWISNVVPTGMAFSDKRDLLAQMHQTIRYSTAINFSTRFPLISPGAAVTNIKNIRQHFVDGGYVENTGAQSMIELLLALREDSTTFSKVLPYVLLIRFDEPKESLQEASIRFGNEWNEVFTGLLNTRSGRSELAIHHLKNICTNINKDAAKTAIPDMYKDTVYLEAGLSNKQSEVPMNWLLSGNSLKKVGQYCDSFVEKPTTAKFMQRLRAYPHLRKQVP